MILKNLLPLHLPDCSLFLPPHNSLRHGEQPEVGM